MSNTAHIGQRIRELRKIRQMTVRQLATSIHISPKTLEKYESGDRNPPPGIIAQLARSLHVGPDRLTGQPYLNGAETIEQVQAVIPELRRILLTYDNPDDLLTAPRPLPVVAAEVDHISRMRQDGRYVPMGPLLPGVLSELTHIALSTRDPREQAQAYWWLARGYRATNSLAHKLGYHDLSLTAIERFRWAASHTEDPMLKVTGAYLRAGAMVRMGAYGSARRVLEALDGEIERMAPEGCLPPAYLAVQGAVLLKLAVLEARDGHPERAQQRLAEGRACAELLRQDTTHYEMSFGPTNVRIHEVAALIDLGDTEQALARLREWGAEQDNDEWELPSGIAAERASHHHIDVAAARLAEGDRAGAHRDLVRARELAPNHVRFHPTVRQTAAALVRLDRGQSDTIAGFARWTGV
ncbi:helix-turn-helix transcriptional regulator [Streptomyces sp. TRM76323]|uniref:Helix-turn-helix transcriptional regulator n=1 Tax=Streptomyces tamarix TaxID=3078565 RepID=A0ABU3QH08_9ACTN|nr:helix-turn-helix transcriptional regulator [Streptomyces tamarix]MDT9682044.1 helix-turn-helix transcriptional regulator [Streptomyces tamarix]